MNNTILKNKPLTNKVNRAILKSFDKLRRATNIPISLSTVKVTNNPVTAITSSYLKHYFKNENHNELIISSVITATSNIYLIASLGKPLNIPNLTTEFSKVLTSNIYHKINMEAKNVDARDFNTVVNTLSKFPQLSVKHDYMDLSSQVTITYSQFCYHDRSDNNYLVDDDLNHDRLMNIEMKINGF